MTDTVEDLGGIMPQHKILYVDKVIIGECNARSDLGDLDDLTASISSVGVKEPILVKDLGEGTYEVFAGFRRLEASKKAGKKKIPALIHPKRVATAKQMLLLNLVENVQREDLNPMDEARALKKLQSEYGLSDVEVCEKIGIKKSRLLQRLNLLTLSPVIQDAIHESKISMVSATQVDRLPKELHEKFIGIAQELTGARLVKLVDRELAKIDKQLSLEEEGPKKGDTEKSIITGIVRGLRKSLAVVVTSLEYDNERQTRLKDVNFRALETEDLQVISDLFDDIADSIPEEIVFNEKGTSEIIEKVEKRDIPDMDSSLTRQALISSIRSRATEIAEDEAAISGKKARVTYANAVQALREFYPE